MGEVIEDIVAKWLDAVASGNADAQLVFADIARHEDAIVGRPLLEKAWMLVQHYANDADIRAKDSGYGDGQREEMRKLARKLREGTSR